MSVRTVRASILQFEFFWAIRTIDNRQLALAMTLKHDMIVTDCDHRLPSDAALQRSRQRLAGFLCHRLARSRGELPGPQDIVKVLFASIRFRIERTQSSFDQGFGHKDVTARRTRPSFLEILDDRRSSFVLN